MTDRPTIHSALEQLSRAYADSPDPKHWKKLQSRAQTYQAYTEQERASYERLIGWRANDPERWRAVDRGLRENLSLYEQDKAAYLELRGRKETA